MSKKNSITTCSGIEWNIMLGLLYRLRKDNRIKEYLLLGVGCFLGLRATDLFRLRWSDLLNKDELIIEEQKTGKIRQISINESLKEILNYVVSLRKLTFSDFSYQKLSLFSSYGVGIRKYKPKTRCWLVH